MTSSGQDRKVKVEDSLSLDEEIENQSSEKKLIDEEWDTGPPKIKNKIPPVKVAPSSII